MTAAGREGGGPHGPERDERVTLPATERLARRGPGPVLVALLVAAAFVVGVVRPWDWLAPGPASPGSGQAGQATGGTAGATGSAAPVRRPLVGRPMAWPLAGRPRVR